MADELAYSSDDLYGQYGYEGGQNVTFSALDAIISNLKVSSAQIENLAVTDAHIQNISAAKITSGQIATQRLDVAGLTNLVGNYKFADGKIDGWSGAGIAQALAKTSPVTPDSVHTPSDYYGVFTNRDAYYGDWIDVNPGESFYVAAWACNADSTYPYYVGVMFQKPDGTQSWFAGVTFPSTTTTWTNKEGVVKVPVGYTQAKVWVSIPATANTNMGNWCGTLYTIRRQGIITADAITTGTLNAITVNSSTITGGTIDGSTITNTLGSATIQMKDGRLSTLFSGDGIVLGSNALQFNNRNGQTATLEYGLNGILSISNSGPSFTITRDIECHGIITSNGIPTITGASGTTRVYQSATTRMSATATHGLGVVPRSILATVKWVSGATSLDYIGEIYTQDWNGSTFGIQITNMPGFSIPAGAWIDVSWVALV